MHLKMEVAAMSAIEGASDTPATGRARAGSPLARRDLMKVIVVGGGPAGITAAVRARQLGAEVLLLERQRLGGVSYNEGPVPVRTLARAARMVRDAGAWARFGLVGAAPRVDLAAALANARQAVRHVYEELHAADKLRALGIYVAEEIGTVRFVTPHALAVADGGLFEGDRIILAVGGHDRRLPIPGAELGLSFRDVLHLVQLPARIVVIGGAATGCQLASIFRDFGAAVTLVEAQPRLIPDDDVDLGQALGAAFVARGIDLRTGTRSERLERDDSVINVDLRRGDETARVAAEAVFFAVGWPGNLDELALDAAGVASERGYITVDAQLRTSQPHIFAVGDVNGIRKLVQAAAHQGRLAAENAVLDQERSYASGIIPAGSFTDPEYASVGLTEAQAHAERDCVVERYDYRRLTRAVTDGRVDGFCKLVAERGSGRLLGAHVLGEYSAEIIQVAAACMAARMTVREVAEVQFAYPTFTQAIGLGALHLAQELGLLPSGVFDDSELGEASAQARR
jgi:pyruvate/2-oxoglutarate dehydrogenase complex dihydrolipoamide dehydrogenase (E3) component